MTVNEVATEVKQESRQVVLTFWETKIAEHMLANSRQRYTGSDIARTLGAEQPTVARILRRWFDYGWVDRVQAGAALRYRFTAGTAPMLRRALDA